MLKFVVGLVLTLALGLAGCGGDGGGGTPVASAPPGAPPPPPPPSSAPPPPPAAPAAENPAPASDIPDPSRIPNTDQQPAPNEPAPAENPAPTPPAVEPQPAPAPAADPATPPPPKAPTLRERALTAFQAGKDDEAFQLLATHYLVSLDATEDLVSKMQWVPGQRRPALATRFGLAVAYTAPSDFKEHPQPIGSKEAATAYAANLRQPASGNPNAAAPAGGAGEQAATYPESTNAAMNSLTYYTGEVGSKLVAALKGKIEAGTFGETLKEATAFTPPVDPNQPQPPAVAPEPNDKNHSHPGQLTPGVMFLGTTSEANAAALGKRSSADVLIVLEVSVRPAKAISFVNNTIKFRATNAKTGAVLFTSDQIVNLKLLEDRRKGAKGEDPIDKEIVQAVAAIEKAFTPAPLPETLTAEIAKKRISDLAAEKPSDPLPLLLEARYYVAKGLMKQDDLMTVMMDAVGPEKLAQVMKKVEGADLDALLGKVLADPNLGKLLEGVDPSKLPGLAPGGKVDAGALLEKLFPKAGDKPAEAAPAGDKPAVP